MPVETVDKAIPAMFLAGPSGRRLSGKILSAENKNKDAMT